MHPVDEFILNYQGKQREIMLYISHLLLDQPGVYGKITYKIPFFYRKSWLCYLNPTRDGGIEFAFIRGHELSNDSGLLISRGRKQVMGITFYDVREIPYDSIAEIIHEAILLDEQATKNPKSASDRSAS
ncbi:MAG: hypothetical protein FD166_951 [Bacteroidetes bacterium]|nr:MAG: hypothetical protein FD166_951 [Bacteroidota bacterium]